MPDAAEYCVAFSSKTISGLAGLPGAQRTLM